MSETGTQGEAWAGDPDSVVISRAVVFKAVSLDEITQGVRVDRKKMRCSSEPPGIPAPSD